MWLCRERVNSRENETNVFGEAGVIQYSVGETGGCIYMTFIGWGEDTQGLEDPLVMGKWKRLTK